MHTGQFDGGNPQLRLFLPRCIKLITKISYYIGWAQLLWGSWRFKLKYSCFYGKQLPSEASPQSPPFSLPHRSLASSWIWEESEELHGKNESWNTLAVSFIQRMAHTGKSPTRPAMEPLWNDYELTGPLRPHLSSGNLTAVLQTVGDPRTLASTSALFPGRSLLVPRSLNSCTGGWLLLEGFLRWQARLRSSWHKGVTKKTWEYLWCCLSCKETLSKCPPKGTGLAYYSLRQSPAKWVSRLRTTALQEQKCKFRVRQS